jgi:hypothetical protein
MRIETYILAHQEERMIGYTLKHYTQFSDVILLEGHSQDRTVEIAESYGARIINIDTNNQVNDRIYLDVKNNVWKGSKADWVIIADTDELVYHKNIKEYLKDTPYTIFIPQLWNMFSEVYPTTDGQIYDEVQYGVPGGSKINLFRPDQITDINYLPGCHNAKPTGNVNMSVNSEIITMHFKNLSREWVIERNKYLFNRMSDINKLNRWGWHTGANEQEVNQFFDDNVERLLKII